MKRSSPIGYVFHHQKNDFITTSSTGWQKIHTLFGEDSCGKHSITFWTEFLRSCERFRNKLWEKFSRGPWEKSQWTLFKACRLFGESVQVCNRVAADFPSLLGVVTVCSLEFPMLIVIIYEGWKGENFYVNVFPCLMENFLPLSLCQNFVNSRLEAKKCLQWFNVLTEASNLVLHWGA